MNALHCGIECVLEVLWGRTCGVLGMAFGSNFVCVWAGLWGVMLGVLGKVFYHICILARFMGNVLGGCFLVKGYPYK